MSNADFLIWSPEHDGYWIDSHHGYTADVQRAARFTMGEAIQICNDANLFPNKPPNDLIVPVNPLWTFSSLPA